MSVMDRERAEQVAAEWLHAFNAHRADLVVEHFADDVTAISPVIARLRPGSEGHLRSKEAVLDFYQEGLRLVPELHFTLVEVLCGIGQITIVYRNQVQTLIAETLTFGAGDLVQAVNVAYGATPTP